MTTPPFATMFRRQLDTLAHLLTAGAAHAAATGTSEAAMLDWRLVDDMFPLWRQAQIVVNFAGQWPARAAGVAVPVAHEGEQDLASLLAAIDAAKRRLSTLTPSDAAVAADFTMDLGVVTPTMPVGRWLEGFATTNLYFHLSIAYAILRVRGVPIGKPDLFAGGL